MSPVIADQMAFAASSSPRPPRGCPVFHHCGITGHLKARCFKLHLELRHTYSKNRLPSFSSPCTATISETTGNIVHFVALTEFGRLQAQIGQLQDKLGLLLGLMIQQLPLLLLPQVLLLLFIFSLANLLGF